MCGIAGYLDRRGRLSAEDGSRLARSMACTLRHRGPDDHDVWVDAESGIALAHRRLSIVDLTPTGHQPMRSADGRFVISYNGEIYNHQAIRRELEASGIAFRGTSDTEVMLEAFSAWGVRPALDRLAGMFAFALWDRRTRTLRLVRDRLGIKPLYWARFGDLVLFGSELKALRAHSGWTPEVDRDALAAFLRLKYVPAPLCIYRGVRKLEPGSLVTFRPGGEPALDRYWDFRAIAAQGARDRSDLTEPEAIDQLDGLLRDVVRRHMVADVPLGGLLSGGIDSSCVVALMQAQSDRPIRTFSIGFRESGYNEAEEAGRVAAHLGTDHTELYVEPEDALDVIPSLPEWYDEPFADSSQIPTGVLSRLTRRYVTVALSGDGGDELFAGYDRYFWGDLLSRRLDVLPRAVRGALSGAAAAVPAAVWDRWVGFLPGGLKPSRPGEKMRKAAEILALSDATSIYRRLMSDWDDPRALVPGAEEPRGILWDTSLASEFPALIERAQVVDVLSYLPDDILTKVDRASMMASLELRVPLLDHRVAEFAVRLPLALKVRRRRGKWLLRQVLYRYAPASLFDRPKMGFGVPIASWLRGPLRDWADALLSPRVLEQGGVFDAGLIVRRWAEHLQGSANWEYPLWNVLMFQAWKDRWLPA